MRGDGGCVCIWVRHDNHAADFQRGVVGNDRLGAVGQDNHHAVTGAHTEAVKRVSELIGLLVKFSIGQRRIEKDGSGSLRHPIGGAFEKPVERLTRDGDGVRRVLAVACQPGALFWQTDVAGIPPGWATLLADKPFDGAVHCFVAFQLDFVLGRANVV